MKKYASCDNYFSIDEIEKIAIAHDLNVRVVIGHDCFYFVLYSMRLGIDLGQSRKIVRIPSQSRYPRLSFVCHSNRFIVENFK